MPSHSLIIAIGVSLLGWASQIVGHWFFEESKYPAISDNLIQALALAPLFVYLEFLFAIGYRPLLQSKIQLQDETAPRDQKNNKIK